MNSNTGRSRKQRYQQHVLLTGVRKSNKGKPGPHNLGDPSPPFCQEHHILQLAHVPFLNECEDYHSDQTAVLFRKSIWYWAPWQDLFLAQGSLQVRHTASKEKKKKETVLKQPLANASQQLRNERIFIWSLFMQHLKFFNIHGTETKCLQKETYSSPVDFRTGRQTGHSGDFCSVTAFLVIRERADWKIPRFLHYFLYLMEETYTRKALVDSQNQRAQSECLGRDT